MDPGRRTFYLGRYNCIEQLGTGPLGETFRAKIYGVAGFEKQFAVKRLHAQLSSDEAFVARFVPAASAFAALEHQRIARVHEVNAQGAQYYIVIDLIRGLDLRRLLDLLRQRGEALAPDLAMTIAVDIAEALEYAHGKTNILPTGVLHLGLTAASAMVTYEGEVKLVDVGLLASLVRPGWSDDDELAPTLAYLAPEELRGEAVDGRADVFSLGVVLHELVGGSRVFVSDRASELRAAIAAGPPPPPPGDPRLQQAITRALHPDPGQRFATMAELRAALQAIVGGRIDRARSELSALVRRLAAPRERRTGAFATVTLPPAATGLVTPVSTSKPPPIPPQAWAPPVPKPPKGPVLSTVPTYNTLAGIGPDDAALSPIELADLPGFVTEKAMPTVSADEAERVTAPSSPAHDQVTADTPEAGRGAVNGAASESTSTAATVIVSGVATANGTSAVGSAVDHGDARASTASGQPAEASESPSSVASAANGGDARAAVPSAAGGQSTSGSAPEPSWTPPVVMQAPPSPVPTFASALSEAPVPIERPSSPVPGVKLPPRERGAGAAIGLVLLLGAAGGVALYAGLSGSERAKPETPTAPATVATSEPAATKPEPTPPTVVAPEEPTAKAVAPENEKPETPTPAARAQPKPALAQPQAAPSAEDTVEIVTTPPGADVYVDGQPRGQSPVRVPPGKHSLIVAGEHSKLLKRDMTFVPNHHLELTLEPAEFSDELSGREGLKVRCHTHGQLRILVDGEDSGLSCPNDERISIKPGTHKIGLFDPRTGETHELERTVEESDYSTRVYVKY
jgi:serine/threonine protein kinase